MIHQKGTPAYVPAYIPVSKLEPSFQTSQNSFTPPPLLASAEPLILPLSSPSHSQETGPTHLLSHARYVGNLFQTYFVYEDRKDLILVDQHAAHERIRYEILRKKFFGEKSKHTPQALLIPETISFVFEQKEFLEAQIPKLSQFGFEVEFFGEQTLLFRAIPLEWGHHQLKTRLKNLVERLIEQSSSSKSTQFPHLLPNLFMDENFFEALASEACHSAIRSGDLLQHPKIDQLIEQLFECEHPWNCPHGRPTIVQIPQTKFEEWFQRRSSV
jgi:DNA mismatch repair protein MutL